MSKIIRMLGIDPSLTHTGWAVVDIDLETCAMVRVVEHGTIITAKSKNKRVRKSSDDLERARSIAQGIDRIIVQNGVKITTSEVPSGAQNANAARAFGIVVGLLGSIKLPVIEVNPSEVKVAATGSKVADKEDIVRWAVGQTEVLGGTSYWNTTKGENDWGIMVGKEYVTKTMEHQGDALACVQAALLTQEFAQIAAVLAQF